MVNSKAEPDSLISVHVEPPVPRAIVDPNRIQLVDWKTSEREYIGQRVTTFMAHQQRFTREREDHAAAELERMRNSLFRDGAT
jgi:hypothetical protein